MGSAHQAKLVKLIQQAGTRYDAWKVFSDFVDLLACAISNRVDLRSYDEREEHYMKVIGGYDKETQALFPQMAGELTLALDDGAHAGHFEDVLGQTFHDLGVENKWKGQFFTPINLSDLMAELSFDEKNGFAKVYEPACGAGSTILGFANAHMMKHPEQPFDDFCVFAGDIDARCVHMCYVQLSLCGIAARVEQRNALSMELVGGVWYTPMWIIGGWDWKLRRNPPVYHKDREKELPQGCQEVSKDKKELLDKATEDEQMSLF